MSAICLRCENYGDGCPESCIDCECARCIHYQSHSECCLGAMMDRSQVEDDDDE